MMAGHNPCENDIEIVARLLAQYIDADGGVRSHLIKGQSRFSAYISTGDIVFPQPL